MAHLNELIAAVRRRWFVTVALRTIGLAAAIAAVPVIGGVMLDRLTAPAGLPLVLLAAATALLALAGAAIVAIRIERRPSDRRVARFVEERASQLPGIGSLDDCVVSAVDASAGKPEHAPFVALIVASAMRRLQGIAAADLVSRRALQRAGGIALGGVLSLLLAVVIGLPSLTRAIETARLQFFPEALTVEVLPGDTRVVGGHPLKIRAKLRMGSRDFTQLLPHLVVSAGDDARTVEMVRSGDAFEFDIESIDRTFRYQVRAGSVASRQFTVTALFPPRVTRIDLRYDYPSFSGLAARDEQDAGDIYAPAGTRVRVRIHTDKPIASGQLALSTGPVALTDAGGSSVDAELVLTRDDSYRIRLSDKDGLTANGDSEYFIRLMDDRPPDVRILRPSSDQGITPLEEVTIEARADDDYGVSTLELVYAVGGGREHVLPFSSVSGTPIQKIGAHLLAAEDLKVRPGDVITYYARARDIGRGKRPSETKSDIFFLEVKPFNEEFVAAQSQAGAGQSGDPQIDSLVSAQKEIISATWNIERRSQGGRSADDINTIAKAQAELKARVERLVAASRGRRIREPLPQAVVAQAQPVRPASGEGLAAAVEAMARAVEQLGTQKTREAIPHEMAALNGLLQAQAEVRRRQVTQQANAFGNGGSNRSGQDLSALFDKELQRQQRTNYEQRSQIEERPDQRQSNDDALNRIKDLARRQEEINQKQRDLAQMAADERKRELEKLSRDQQELREQAEALARQMGQQQGSSQGRANAQQQPQQNAAGSSGMRDAAQQMGAAANDMRRQDASAAQQSGQRAADQLRRMEQQMRGGDAGSRQRAAGELQSEAQQIAQEQRRIAAEAERLGKGGESTADARRRLAAEKDRLADRVDELQRSAEQLGRESLAGRSSQPGQRTDGGGEQTANAREAAAELQRQRVAQRMRDSASQMLKGGAGKPDANDKDAKGQAATEQQIARALDQVVDKLGGSASAEARKLSEQLDRSRELRNRLDQLEGQMRQAQGKKDGSLEKLQQQYAQELSRGRQAMGSPGSGDQRNSVGTSTPEQQEFSRSAPGTEAFKQDRSGWESLRKDLNRAMEQHDAAVSRRLASKLGDARLSAGGSDRVPEEYRQFIARYYESLAKAKK